MSKTGRGILRDPGPYFCLYSPECVEEEFSEVRIRDPAYPRPYPDGEWPTVPPEYLTLNPTSCGGE